MTPGTLKYNDQEIKFIDVYRESEDTWVCIGENGNEYILSGFYISSIRFDGLECGECTENVTIVGIGPLN